MKIDAERLLLYDANDHLIVYFNIWKILDVATIDDMHIAVSFDSGKRLILNLFKDKIKNKMMDSLEEMLKKKKRYFSTIPFTIMDYKDMGTAMNFLIQLYIGRKFTLPRPKIWGKHIPPFYEELAIFRYETARKRDIESRAPTKVKRRKTMTTLKGLDLDNLIEEDKQSGNEEENKVPKEQDENKFATTILDSPNKYPNKLLVTSKIKDDESIIEKGNVTFVKNEDVHDHEDDMKRSIDDIDKHTKMLTHSEILDYGTKSLLNSPPSTQKHQREAQSLNRDVKANKGGLSKNELKGMNIIVESPRNEEVQP